MGADINRIELNSEPLAIDPDAIVHSRSVLKILLRSGLGESEAGDWQRDKCEGSRHLPL